MKKPLWKLLEESAERMRLMNKPEWERLPGNERLACFTALFGGTRYWIRQAQDEHTWHVEDDCGGVWGDFKTAEEAMREVEGMHNER